MIGKTMEELIVGDYADLSRTVFEFDINLLAGVNGDVHPTHGNGQFAAKTCLRKGIVDSVCSVDPSIMPNDTRRPQVPSLRDRL